MKQKLKRFMAGFLAMLTLLGTLFTNSTTAFAASPQAKISFWYASTKNSGEISELKAGYKHGKVLYAMLDGNSAYCMPMQESRNRRKRRHRSRTEHRKCRSFP